MMLRSQPSYTWCSDLKTSRSIRTINSRGSSDLRSCYITHRPVFLGSDVNKASSHVSPCSYLSKGRIWRHSSSRLLETGPVYINPRKTRLSPQAIGQSRLAEPLSQSRPNLTLQMLVLIGVRPINLSYDQLQLRVLFQPLFSTVWWRSSVFAGGVQLYRLANLVIC